jgi:hypothetical protein
MRYIAFKMCGVVGFFLRFKTIQVADGIELLVFEAWGVWLFAVLGGLLDLFGGREV